MVDGLEKYSKIISPDDFSDSIDEFYPAFIAVYPVLRENYEAP